MTNFDIVKKSREQGTDSLYLTKICQFYALSGIREQTLETMKIFDIVRYLGNRKQAPCIWLKFVTFRLYMGSGNRLLKTMKFLDILREEASCLLLKFLTFRSYLGSGNRLLIFDSNFSLLDLIWDQGTGFWKPWKNLIFQQNLGNREQASCLQKPVPWSQMRSKSEKFESKTRSLFPVPKILLKGQNFP